MASESTTGPGRENGKFIPKCSVCGDEIIGLFHLASHADKSDRPFLVHDDCSFQLEKQVFIRFCEVLEQ